MRQGSDSLSIRRLPRRRRLFRPVAILCIGLLLTLSLDQVAAAQQCETVTSSVAPGAAPAAVEAAVSDAVAFDLFLRALAKASPAARLAFLGQAGLQGSELPPVLSLLETYPTEASKAGSNPTLA